MDDPEPISKASPRPTTLWTPPPIQRFAFVAGRAARKAWPARRRLRRYQLESPSRTVNRECRTVRLARCLARPLLISRCANHGKSIETYQPTPRLAVAERAALADTIAKIHEAEARIADNEAKINSLFDKSFFRARGG